MAISSRAFASTLFLSLLFDASCRDGTEGPDESADTSKITVKSNFGKLVAGLLGEYQHEVEASCPCRVEEESFASTDECIERLGHDEKFVRCATEKLKGFEDEELREALHCTMNRYKARAECVEDHGCDVDDLAECYEDFEECPVLDPRALTAVITECPGGTLLGR